MSGNIATSYDASPMLRRLYDAVPMIRARLAADGWQGLTVREPATGECYRRVQCVDRLVIGDRPHSVAVHLFDQVGFAGKLHDHRWPIAVLPFDRDGERGAELYAMPWETATGNGEMIVRDGQGWAIDRCSEVRHSVRSIRSHVSIVLADVTDSPARENRLEIEPLADVRPIIELAARTIRRWKRR